VLRIDGIRGFGYHTNPIQQLLHTPHFTSLPHPLCKPLPHLPAFSPHLYHSTGATVEGSGSPGLHTATWQGSGVQVRYIKTATSANEEHHPSKTVACR
jgi:hypothetical protein